MALQNQKALYEIELRRTGTGAAETVQQFQQVQQAAAGTNTALAANTAGFATLGTATKQTANGLRALQGVATIIGFQTFPQLTLAASSVSHGLKAVQASGAAVTAGIGLTTASIVGLVAALVSAVFWWGKFRAEQQAAVSERNLNAQTRDFAERLKQRVEDMRAAGDITNEQARNLTRQLGRGTLEGNQSVRDWIQDAQGADAQTLIADQRRAFANSAAALEFDQPEAFNQKKFQQLQIQMQYNDQVKLYNALRQEGLITEKQLTDLTMEADTARMNSLIQIRKQLTEIQMLGQRVAENFASGLSQALVNVWTEGGKAMKDFFRQFMQQTAQMIMQLLIMKALRGVFGGALFGEGGFAFAPTYAANGLAGVNEVTSATYFPRFNVVAGEAGREMMTVLAKPRMMEIGGMQAVVGSAGNNRLAITNADQLASRAGGILDIRVTLGPELRAEIVNESVQGARVTVAQDMQQDSAISRGVKQLTA